MSELKPCPFCSAEPEILSDGRRTWGLVQHNDGCLFPTYPKHEIPESDFTAWNTRAERTCHFIDDSDGEFPPKCSACDYEPSIYECSWLSDGGYEFEGNYCPNCGAKVVGE